ncbi:MAG: hypothetical protein JKX83_11210 [Pseudomonadales bacterium]|nr:hypothetical protein [Pseudomonadales bacterium]
MIKKILLALPVLFGLSLSNSSLAVSGAYPDSFDLLCDRIYMVGYEQKNILASYLSWDRKSKTLTIKSEELNEYNDELAPDQYLVFSAIKDDKEDTVIELTFKRKSKKTKWASLNTIRIVALEVASPNDSSNAFIKVTDFYVKYGVVQNVTTVHSACNFRNSDVYNKTPNSPSSKIAKHSAKPKQSLSS